MALPVEMVFTTKYDYSLERSVESDFKKKYMTKETTYSLKRYQIAGNKQIFHIHGEVGYPYSISLGFERYCGALEKLRASIVENVKIEKRFDHSDLESI
jgi:hypothetical protein